MEKTKHSRSTISDVAKRAGVSKTTVSRYLSGQYEVLAEDTRKKIETAIAELDYRPNQMARGLKRNRSGLIGMVVADITNPFSTSILRGAEDECNKHGYSLMVCNTDNDPAKERDYIFMLQAHRIDGLIINTTGYNNEFLSQLALDDTPVVLVDRKIPALRLDTVGVDNQTATAEAILHLVEQGYEHIAFFTEPVAGISTRMERLDAFTRTLREQGLDRTAGEVYEIDLGLEGQLAAQVDRYLECSREAGAARAIFAQNGVIMLKLLLALQAKGLQVPSDLAVTGFDNLDWAPVVGAGITTVAQPTYEIGVTAMERVLHRLEGGSNAVQTVELPAKLIVRGSTPRVK